MITFQQLIDYSNASYYFLRKKQGNADTKLGYAISRMAKPIEKALKPYKELIEEQQIEIEDINIKNAMTDKTTQVLIFDTTKDEQGKDVRNYKYTPDALIKRNKEIREVIKKYEKTMEDFLEKEVKLANPYYATEIPSDLTQQEKEAFDGIVLNPIALKVSSNGVEKLVEQD